MDRSESPAGKDSPAESQGKRHHISAPSGPSSMHGGSALTGENLDIVFGGPERKVSRVQKGKSTHHKRNHICKLIISCTQNLISSFYL